MKIFLITLLTLFLFQISTKAQEIDSLNTETSYQLTASTGYMAYNNSITIPNGLPGITLGLHYQLNKIHLNKKRHFIYDLQFRYGGLTNSYVTSFPQSNYIFGNIKTGASWLLPILNSSNKINLSGGSGLFWNGEFINPLTNSSPIIDNSVPFGCWSTSANIRLRLSTKVDNISITNTFNMPVIGFGYFADFSDSFTVINISENMLGLFTKPNKVTHLGNHLLIDNELKFEIPYKNINLSLAYIFTYNDNHFVYFNQKYLQHQLGFGIRF